MIGWLVRCADETGKELHELRRDAFHAWLLSLPEESGERPTRHDIEGYNLSDGRGAWNNLVQYASDETGSYAEPDIRQMGSVRELQKTNAHRRKLERIIGDDERFVERLSNALAEAVEKNPPRISSVKREKPKKHVGERREIVLHVSDTHWGHSVDRREVPGGRYDYTVAARRMGLLCEQVVRFKHDDNVTLRLVIAGDVIEGSIHNDDRGVDALSSQLDASRQYLTSMIDYFRHHFSEIRVETCAGNHDRFAERDRGKRPMAQKWDGHATVLYRGIEAIFRDAPEVTFNIPRTPYAKWDAFGHAYFATHGDGVFQVGTPGKSIQLEKLHSQLWKLESSEVGRCDVIMLGHLHWPALSRIPGRQPSAYLAINGSASGRVPFTQTLNLACSPPVQCFWEVTERFPVGNYRQADLWLADDDASYEDIVPVPTPIGATPPRGASRTTRAAAQAFGDAITKKGKRR
jgi:predicted phosphodiesterase